jgi:glyoxylase I family protein
MDFRFHHAAISVADMGASLDFYRELGFELVVDYAGPGGSPRICHLRLGEALLELFWFQGNVPAPESASRLETDLPRVGSKHFALQVDSIDEAKAFVKARGWAPEVAVVNGRTGVRYFFVPDPNGILLEFVEDRRDLHLQRPLG